MANDSDAPKAYRRATTGNRPTHGAKAQVINLTKKLHKSTSQPSQTHIKPQKPPRCVTIHPLSTTRGLQDYTLRSVRKSAADDSSEHEK